MVSRSRTHGNRLRIQYVNALSCPVMREMSDILKSWRGGLIVSCQAAAGEPLYGAHHVAALARAAVAGGAVGVRTDAPPNIQAVAADVNVPVVASYKLYGKESEIYVTPTFDAARQVVAAGADVVGMDATARPRPGGETASDMIRRIHEELCAGVMADVSTFEEAVAALRLGADFITMALVGYTSYSPPRPQFDFELLTRMVGQIGAPIIAEGGIDSPADAAQALACGAFAVVVGTAITRPHKITERFVHAMRPAVK